MFAGACYLAYGPVLELFKHSSPHARKPYEVSIGDFARCGTQSTADFAGKYAVLSDPGPANDDREDAITNFEILPDRIRFDRTLQQELCLTKVSEQTPSSLGAEALWHEDVQDPGDAVLMQIKLERSGDTTTLSMWNAEDGPSSVTRYRLQRR